jgi:hypothetical protein
VGNKYTTQNLNSPLVDARTRIRFSVVIITF